MNWQMVPPCCWIWLPPKGTGNDCTPVTDEVEALFILQVFNDADVGSTYTNVLVPPLPWAKAGALYGCPCCADLYWEESPSQTEE
jgi:hypothetical protein